MRLAGLVVAAVLLIVSAWGCGEDTPEGGEPQDVEGLWKQEFASTAVSEGDRPRPLVPGTRIELSFTGPKDPGIGWSAGCNGHGASVQVSPEKLHLGPIGGTLMGCPSPLEKQDEWLADFFESNPTWQLDGGQLTLAAEGTMIEFES